jgi:hypothetical protein
MPLGSRNIARGRLAFHVGFALCVACTPPDGSVLFEPLLPGAGGAMNTAAGGGGVGGSVVSGSGGAASGGASSSSPSEGQGGSLPLAGGAPGTGGGGDVSEADAAAPSVSPEDAGVPEEPEREDAAPPPIPCDPNPERCDGVDNDCDALIDEGGACPGPCEGFALEDHGYMFCGESVTRAVAIAACAAEQMKLAWLETPEENAALVARIADLDVVPAAGEVLVQIGANDSDDEDEWFWVPSGPATGGFQFWQGNPDEDANVGPVGGAYANWANGEPNNTDGEDCAAFSLRGNDDIRDPGEWDDRDCNGTIPFVCEDP